MAAPTPHSVARRRPPRRGRAADSLCRCTFENEQCDAPAGDEAPASSLGHEVLVPSDMAADEVPAMLERLRPDVALIRLGTGRGRAFDLIERIVEQAMCPEIPVTHGEDRGSVRAAAKAGTYASVGGEQTGWLRAGERH